MCLDALTIRAAARAGEGACSRHVCLLLAFILCNIMAEFAIVAVYAPALHKAVAELQQLGLLEVL